MSVGERNPESKKQYCGLFHELFGGGFDANPDINLCAVSLYEAG